MTKLVKYGKIDRGGRLNRNNRRKRCSWVRFRPYKSTPYPFVLHAVERTMSKYVDILLEKGFTLEELYKKGIIGEIEKKEEVNEEVEEVKEEEKTEEAKEEKTEEVKEEKAEYITKDDFFKTIEDLKKSIFSNNIKNNGVETLKDDSQITIDDAINGLYYGGK